MLQIYGLYLYSQSIYNFFASKKTLFCLFLTVFGCFWLFLPHYKHIFPIFLIYNAVIPTSQRTLFITLPVVSKLESTNHLSSTSNPFSSSMSASVILMAPCPRTASPLMGSPEARCGQHPSERTMQLAEVKRDFIRVTEHLSYSRPRRSKRYFFSLYTNLPNPIRIQTTTARNANPP